MTSCRLADLAQLPGVVATSGDLSGAVAGVVSDSRRVRPGMVFAAITGQGVDGVSFVPRAIAAGAAGVIAARPLGCSVPELTVRDVRAALGPLAHRAFGDPTLALSAIGVTGTNGKTTVTHLVESILKHAGHQPALMGTVALRGPSGERAAELTTPEADVVAEFAAHERAHGATHFVMEVSSHALAQGRASGVRFSVAAFTNLTQDHLDFHGTMSAYGEAKARLFTEHAPQSSVICVDGAFGKELARRARGKVLRCAVSEPDVELGVRSFASTRAGIVAEIFSPAGEHRLESPLFGAHNLENLLVAFGIGLCVGVDARAIVEALQSAQGAPGRMERVHDRRGVLVLVDYAHTPDALERALSALRPLTPGRLFVVAGCGGDRDRKKRAPMGKAAAGLADIALLTSDNPRSEEPAAILAQMVEGARQTGRPERQADELSATESGYCLAPDRRRAIELALRTAQAGDTVLIAGKGHETYQMIGANKLPFDDREEARKAIFELGGA